MVTAVTPSGNTGDEMGVAEPPSFSHSFVVWALPLCASGTWLIPIGTYPMEAGPVARQSMTEANRLALP